MPYQVLRNDKPVPVIKFNHENVWEGVVETMEEAQELAISALGPLGHDMEELPSNPYEYNAMGHTIEIVEIQNRSIEDKKMLSELSKALTMQKKEEVSGELSAEGDDIVATLIMRKEWHFFSEPTFS